VDDFILDALPRYPLGERIGNFALSTEHFAAHNHDICRNELSAQQRRKPNHFRTAILDVGFDDQEVESLSARALPSAWEPKTITRAPLGNAGAK
jgi:hypothetical protein